MGITADHPELIAAAFARPTGLRLWNLWLATREEIVAWHRHVSNPLEPALWLSARPDMTPTNPVRSVPHIRELFADWADTAVATDCLYEWATAGGHIEQSDYAEPWYLAGFTSTEAASWDEVGFSHPDDLRVWRELTGLNDPTDVMISTWVDAGFDPLACPGTDNVWDDISIARRGGLHQPKEYTHWRDAAGVTPTGGCRFTPTAAGAVHQAGVRPWFAGQAARRADPGQQRRAFHRRATRPDETASRAPFDAATIIDWWDRAEHNVARVDEAVDAWSNDWRGILNPGQWQTLGFTAADARRWGDIVGTGFTGAFTAAYWSQRGLSPADAEPWVTAADVSPTTVMGFTATRLANLIRVRGGDPEQVTALITAVGEHEDLPN